MWTKLHALPSMKWSKQTLDCSDGVQPFLLRLTLTIQVSRRRQLISPVILPSCIRIFGNIKKLRFTAGSARLWQPGTAQVVTIVQFDEDYTVPLRKIQPYFNSRSGCHNHLLRPSLHSRCAKHNYGLRLPTNMAAELDGHVVLWRHLIRPYSIGK